MGENGPATDLGCLGDGTDGLRSVNEEHADLLGGSSPTTITVQVFGDKVPQMG